MKRIALHVPLALGAMLVGAAPAAASTAMITSFACASDGWSLETEIRYRAQATGESYIHRGTIVRTSSGYTGTTWSYDSAGRLLLVAQASSTSSKPSLISGSFVHIEQEPMIRAVLADPYVQNQLTACAAPAALRPWKFYCPVFTFDLDEDLDGGLCGWLPDGPEAR